MPLLALLASRPCRYLPSSLAILPKRLWSYRLFRLPSRSTADHLASESRCDGNGSCSRWNNAQLCARVSDEGNQSNWRVIVEHQDLPLRQLASMKVAQNKSRHKPSVLTFVKTEISYYSTVIDVYPHSGFQRCTAVFCRRGMIAPGKPVIVLQASHSAACLQHSRCLFYPASRRCEAIDSAQYMCQTAGKALAGLESCLILYRSRWHTDSALSSKLQKATTLALMHRPPAGNLDKQARQRQRAVMLTAASHTSSSASSPDSSNG